MADTIEKNSPIKFKLTGNAILARIRAKNKRENMGIVYVAPL